LGFYSNKVRDLKMDISYFNILSIFFACLTGVIIMLWNYLFFRRYYSLEKFRKLKFYIRIPIFLPVSLCPIFLIIYFQKLLFGDVPLEDQVVGQDIFRDVTLFFYLLSMILFSGFRKKD
jgi:hypothetical protein